MVAQLAVGGALFALPQVKEGSIADIWLLAILVTSCFFLTIGNLYDEHMEISWKEP